MSTLKTNNIEHLDASSASIQTTSGGGVIFAGISTFQVDANFDANVNIAGTITYEDVTSVDSVGVITARDAIVISEDNAIHFRGTAADDADAILRASAGGGQLLINSRNDAIINIDSNNDSTDAHFAVAHGAATGSSTELFRVQENGNLGIGENNPQNSLHISGSSPAIRFADTGANASAFSIIEDNDGLLKLRNDAGNSGTGSGIAFEVDAAERLRITSAGDVGIGTAIPITASGYASLSLADTSGGQIEFKQFGGQTSYIWSDNNLNIAADYSGTGQNLIFTVNGNVERLRITSTGRMGLGTNDPAALLEVRDSENTTQGNAQIRISKGVGNGAAPTSISRTNSYLHIGGSEYHTSFGKYNIAFGYTNDEVGSGIPAYIGYVETSLSGYTMGDLVFGTRETYGATDNPTERMRIDKDGHIRFGSSGTGYDSAWSHSNYGNTEVAIDGGGGYGALHLRGDGAGSVNTRFSMGAGDEIFYMCYDDVNARHNIMVNSSGHVRMPQQPAFYAYSSAAPGLTSAGDQVFPNTRLNNGGHYSTSNGRFTAPVAGMYLVSTSVQLYGQNSAVSMSFRINGTDFHGSANTSQPVYDERAGSHDNLLFTAVVSLSQNDYITVWTSQGIRGMQSYFTGHLVG